MSAKPILFFALALTCPLTASAQAAQSKGDAIQQYLRNAEQDLAQKRPDLAIPQLEAALALDPGNIDAQANLGVLLYFKGDAVNAAPHLRAAVKAKPELWKIQVLLGLTEFRTKDADNARVDLEAALPHLKGEKVQREAGNALIASYSASGEMEKAARVVSVLLETQPTDAHLLLLSYRLNTDIANNSLVTLALAAPDSAEMHQAIARELTRRGDEPGAVAHYREAIRLDPTLPGLYFDFGNLLFNSTDQKLQSEAEPQFKAALAANASDEKSQLMLGEIAAQRGDMKAAFDAESRALELQPNDPDACSELAKVLMTMGQRDKARVLLDRAIEMDPTSYTAHYRLSSLDRQEKKFDDAKHELAEYQKYKEMKARLQAIFHEMHVRTEDKPEDDGGMGK
ncbi:MAG TPA: tetratricopeptide repeat protein [Terracidiphilus sp.]|nr:tetratricopeptide repeat protein [Terracidiphilus sp.]